MELFIGNSEGTGYFLCRYRFVGPGPKEFDSSGQVSLSLFFISGIFGFIHRGKSARFL